MWLNTADPAELFAAGVAIALLIVSAVLLASIVVFFLQGDRHGGMEKLSKKHAHCSGDGFRQHSSNSMKRWGILR